MTALLDINDLSVSFGAVRACDKINLSVERGDLMAVVGPNGSGKTTLFRAVCGEVRPNSGRVRLSGRDITAWPPSRVARHGLVRTFQHSMVFPSVTVRENLAIARTIASKRKVANDEERVALSRSQVVVAEDVLASETGLADVLDVVAQALPTGLLRMLGVAISLQAHPTLMMLDEPGAGLNPGEASRLAELLHRIHAAGVTLIIVDHDMAFLAPLCNRMVVLDAGAKLTEGEPQSVLTDRRVIDVYLGSQFSDGK
jgi:ABC-type branched-subunit amino acid transport system ATPase component